MLGAEKTNGPPFRKPPRLSEEITRDLADAISRGAVQWGDFLPTEQTLGEKYAASRTAVRAALTVVATRGMIESLHGRGSRVLPRQRWRLLDQVVHLVREDVHIEARDLTAARTTMRGHLLGVEN
jgi:DNA-binding FadR family transcriptional regulator